MGGFSYCVGMQRGVLEMHPLSAGLLMLPLLPLKISECTQTEFVQGGLEGGGANTCGWRRKKKNLGQMWG